MATPMSFRRFRRGLAFFAGWGLFLAPAPEVWAHDFWIEQRGRELVLLFGHGEQLEEFDVSRVKAAKAFSPGGGEIEVRREKKEKGLLLRPLESPSWVCVEIDNGYWSKTIYGWKNLPKRKASRVVEANRSFGYAKAILTWNEALRQPARGVPLDIVPLENPFLSKVGGSLPCRVLLRGKPLPGAKIEGRTHETVATSDKEGNFQFRLAAGRQLLAVDYKEPVQDDPDADFISYTATLTFEVMK